MSLRLGFWIGGLGAVLATSSLISWAPSLSGVGPGILVVGWLLAGLAGEVVALVRAFRARPIPELPSESRPADGEVGLATMRGVRAEPNRRDGRFRRFVELKEDQYCAEPELPGARRTPPLLGRVVLLSVFIGRDGRSWSDEEIARAHTALERAGRWVEREAIRWGAPVNLELADTYFAVDNPERDDVVVTFVPQGDRMEPIEARATTKALIESSRAAACLGFRDAADWLTRINPRVEADERVWLLHPRCAGRSLAVPLDDTELAGVSLAVCYAREANFPEPLAGPPLTDPVTVVHELLHLFGASDKYGIPLRSFPPGTVTSRDVMRLSESSLSRLRIDPGTAREIGWAVGPA